MTARNGVQLASLALSLAGIVLFCMIGRRYPKFRGIAFAFLFLLVHHAVFYAVLMIDVLTPFNLPFLYGDWSAALRLHGIATMALSALQVLATRVKKHAD